ncbi:unnamed protein product, partial [Iphiclides podalirius]
MVLINKAKPAPHKDAVENVIDLGAPKKRRTVRAPYTPSARLYPGPQVPKKKSHSGDPTRNRRSKARQPRPLVPNPRLYQPCPRRGRAPPPPVCPSVPWWPPATVANLDTASGAALRLSECRASGPNTPMSLRNGPFATKGQTKAAQKRHRKSRRPLHDHSHLEPSPDDHAFITAKSIRISQKKS